MYSQGKILYFDPFYFKNNNTSKPKYFIVLHKDSHKAILAALPSSKDFIPSFIKITHGCINADDINVNCYHFEANKSITTNDWSFDLPTFVYGSQIDTYDLAMLKDTYKVEGIEYEIIGTLKKEEFTGIVECFIKSKSVKNKFKRILQTLIDN